MVAPATCLTVRAHEELDFIYLLLRVMHLHCVEVSIDNLGNSAYRVAGANRISEADRLLRACLRDERPKWRMLDGLTEDKNNEQKTEVLFGGDRVLDGRVSVAWR